MKKRYQPLSNKERQQKTEEYFEEIVKGVRGILTDEKYKEYLNFSAKLPRYSFNNLMMIYMQNPQATYVAGMKTWNSLGRKIIKGEKALKILAPIQKKFEEEKQNEAGQKEIEEVTKIVGFRTVPVYDVRQTEGMPIPLNPIVPEKVEPSDFAAKIYDHLKNKLNEELPVTEKILDRNGLYGYYTPSEHSITINHKHDVTNKLTTLIHEYAHSIFHSSEGKYKDSGKDVKETQAESFAYLTCKYFGLDSSRFTFPYLASYAGNSDQLLLRHQDEIQKETNRLITKIENLVLEKEITFDVPIRELADQQGSEIVSLYRFGQIYFVTKNIDESFMNNLEVVRSQSDCILIETEKKAEAFRVFNENRVHYLDNDVEILDQKKGYIHLYQIQHEDLFFVGKSGFTGIKRLSDIYHDQSVAHEQFQQVFEHVQSYSKKTHEMELS
ncbi:ArdC-like ssDNA-binding domain-containing protein [Neobacillus mesonae]|uniref:ArdC-like ssDNA-binding domain-containing protein n=1 Tax=Neobacillus mesonae TaxID=1193713 RepID=UPI00204059E1|nr:ArdC-like ssDNA-binding domain-containing protein [Neobacillus mesonae]MCM3571270.1 ArdC-like ssDNA-binding domain-containing protein [Neobacillus mesonae]